MEQELNPRVCCVHHEHLFEQRVQLLTISDSRSESLEPSVLLELGYVEDPTQQGPVAGAVRGKLYRTVRRVEHIGRIAVRHAVATPIWFFAAHGECRECVSLQKEGDVKQRETDALPFAGALPAKQRGKNGVGQSQAAGGVNRLKSDLERRTAALTSRMHHS